MREEDYVYVNFTDAVGGVTVRTTALFDVAYSNRKSAEGSMILTIFVSATLEHQ